MQYEDGGHFSTGFFDGLEELGDGGRTQLLSQTSQDIHYETVARSLGIGASLQASSYADEPQGPRPQDPPAVQSQDVYKSWFTTNAGIRASVLLPQDHSQAMRLSGSGAWGTDHDRAWRDNCLLYTSPSPRD